MFAAVYRLRGMVLPTHCATLYRKLPRLLPNSVGGFLIRLRVYCRFIRYRVSRRLSSSDGGSKLVSCQPSDAQLPRSQRQCRQPTSRPRAW
jgi:hypothetical protein